MEIYRFETQSFALTVTAKPDHDIDLSWDESGEVLEQLESGAFECFQVHVKLIHLGTGIEADDYLGGCIYANPRDFRDHVGINEKGRRDGRRYGSYFTDMVRTVVADMRANVRKAGTIKLRAVQS